MPHGREKSRKPTGGGPRGAGIGKPGYGEHPGTRGARPTRSSVLARKNNKMISRFLVPLDARPPAKADAATQRRRPTTMDERTLVPAMLPIVVLDGRTTIPTNLPLESIATRVVVPRDVNRAAYNVTEDHSTPLQPTDMDERIAVPLGASPPETIESPLNLHTDLVDPDIFITGEVHLAVPEEKEGKAKWQLIVRISSFAFHTLLITLIL